MCLKFSEGSCIEEGDMEPALFAKLLPSLTQTQFLVLNGLGEPLLHPNLEAIIALARTAMPPQAVIGFQSNGLLLDQHRAATLLEAGLDTICLSLDSLQPRTPTGKHNTGHPFSPVAQAVACLATARKKQHRDIRIGIEIVLKQETLPQLPDIVEWAYAHEVDYIITSHLFSYDGTMEEQCLFNPNSRAATTLFAKWHREAAAEGLHLEDLPAAHLKFAKKTSDTRLLQIGAAMQNEAREHGISLHFSNLLKYHRLSAEKTETYFHAAQTLAVARGIQLYLPPLHALEGTERSCPFIDEKAVFIAKNGDVMPCHFLWHTYACMVNQGQIHIQEQSFGTITEQSLATIWQHPRYIRFRKEAEASEYAPCWSCISGPCADLISSNLQDMNDCYGNHVPCGHCMWSLGWTRCL
jgi:putative metalloenzyme radical SAM/SPASM domain maturase